MSRDRESAIVWLIAKKAKHVIVSLDTGSKGAPLATIIEALAYTLDATVLM